MKAARVRISGIIRDREIRFCEYGFYIDDSDWYGQNIIAPFTLKMLAQKLMFVDCACVYSVE